MKQFFFLFTFFLWSIAFAQEPSGEWILNQIDKNLTSENRIITSKMIIHGRRESRTIEAKSWVQGVEKSFTEYLSPAREKGTKMLKLEKMLWLYSPATDRIIQISGHMLRQSVMGSDLSYEDMMEDPKLSNNYDAKVIGSEIVDERDCWIVELTAKVSDIAYHSRKLWVDKERLIPLQEELFAKSGKLLKKMELKDVTNIQGRWYPKRMVFKDMLKVGQGTEFIVDSIQFDQAIPEYIFSKAALRK
ncbi:MAG: outer membrane lipoprotein-sorting protein [candidate division KSB1 bacterium]|nr:outer membrane lipoprotein-sorting protein [candidate division KSB1 bacterium]MDZ7335649.1 outer membrane lipoprotein-sorting protein [candidate division KSB1 bacterium]MDZ7358803.1 outer membrane lipoprotein-sorting protein [candidate division KSB1 bacterium]MDZ7399827.1 outer membrane lipoprotein-sorting protein [candidate division KSB1 bacterium]